VPEVRTRQTCKSLRSCMYVGIKGCGEEDRAEESTAGLMSSTICHNMETVVFSLVDR